MEMDSPGLTARASPPPNGNVPFSFERKLEQVWPRQFTAFRKNSGASNHRSIAGLSPKRLRHLAIVNSRLLSILGNLEQGCAVEQGHDREAATRVVAATISRLQKFQAPFYISPTGLLPRCRVSAIFENG